MNTARVYRPDHVDCDLRGRLWTEERAAEDNAADPNSRSGSSHSDPWRGSQCGTGCTGYPRHACAQRDACCSSRWNTSSHGSAAGSSGEVARRRERAEPVFTPFVLPP